ncbi:MAG: hypothetical protein LBB59_05865 [Campylobacteraceae bacterium]|jgi:hypothetical protein|nr:hypothetical protein [Campylobacteraceae bacterium]
MCSPRKLNLNPLLKRAICNLSPKFAEKRCEHLLEAYNKEKQNERDLYHKAHNIKLNSIHASDKDKAIAKERIEAINLERERSMQAVPRLYDEYLRAVCEEMNKILPEFKEHHERVYHEQIKQLEKGDKNGG